MIRISMWNFAPPLVCLFLAGAAGGHGDYGIAVLWGILCLAYARIITLKWVVALQAAELVQRDEQVDER